MMGIRQLLDLGEKYPSEMKVQTQLARLAIQTGQYEKAEERLNKILKQEPKNTKACCLMAQVLNETGRTNSAEQYDICCSM